MAKPKKVDFEKSLDELTKIVDTMEQGDLSLEQSLKQFEKGVQLTRLCQTALKEAEQSIQVLMKDNDKTTLEPYDEN